MKRKVKKEKIKKAIYTALYMVQFILACEGAGHLLNQYTTLEDPMFAGGLICIIIGGIAFYFNMKDQPEQKHDEPCSLLREEIGRISTMHSASQASHEGKEDKK